MALSVSKGNSSSVRGQTTSSVANPTVRRGGAGSTTARSDALGPYFEGEYEDQKLGDFIEDAQLDDAKARGALNQAASVVTGGGVAAAEAEAAAAAVATGGGGRINGGVGAAALLSYKGDVTKSFPIGGGEPASGDDVLRTAVNRLMLELNEDGFNQGLGEALNDIRGGDAAASQVSSALVDAAGDASIGHELFRSLAIESGAQGAEGVAKTLEVLHRLSIEADNMQSTGANQLGSQMMGGGIEGLSSDSAAAAETMSDEVISRMMKEFEDMGKKEDFNSVIDNMMRQLLNRDLMYIPMKSVCEKFPQYLAKNATKMTKQEYENYGHMYQTYQKIVMLYETEPDNFPHLMELMQDLQERGQPPVSFLEEGINHSSISLCIQE
jgi:peroxin-19